MEGSHVWMNEWKYHYIFACREKVTQTVMAQEEEEFDARQEQSDAKIVLHCMDVAKHIEEDFTVTVLLPGRRFCVNFSRHLES